MAIQGHQHFTHAERMNTIAEIVKLEVDTHITEGGMYYDDQAKLIARKAMVSCMPDMPNFLQRSIVVDSEDSLLFEDLGGKPLKGTTVKKIEGVHVLARLSKIELQAFRLTTPELGGEIDLYDYGMFAVMEPVFVDPNPGEIAFGDELYIPFGGVMSFEPSEREAA